MLIDWPGAGHDRFGPALGRFGPDLALGRFCPAPALGQFCRACQPEFSLWVARLGWYRYPCWLQVAQQFASVVGFGWPGRERASRPSGFA